MSASKYTPETRERLLALLRKGLSYRRAAEGACGGESTFEGWRRQHEDFKAECDSAVAEYMERTHDKVEREGTAGDSLRLLAMRYPEEYGERREEVHKIVLELPGLLKREKALLEVNWEEVDAQAKKGELPEATIELLGLGDGEDED